MKRKYSGQLISDKILEVSISMKFEHNSLVEITK